MKILVEKTLNGLVPVMRSEQDKLQESKLKLGETYEVEIKKKRNIKFHKKLFALLNLAYNNQEQFNNFEEFRSYVTMRAGFYKRIVTEKGEFFLPKSISFSSMDEVEFNHFYDQVFSFILLFLDCSNDDLFSALSDF